MKHLCNLHPNQEIQHFWDSGNTTCPFSFKTLLPLPLKVATIFSKDLFLLERKRETACVCVHMCMHGERGRGRESSNRCPADRVTELPRCPKHYFRKKSIWGVISFQNLLNSQ